MEYNTIDAITDFMCSDEFIMHDVDSEKTDDFLYHHGIFGMHWGVRRFQSKDGTWTPEGLARRRSGISEVAKKANKAISSTARKTFNPTIEDMDEKIAKAKEKEKIAYKKQELRRIQRKNKDLKYMSDQEVQNEIESRKQRRYLEQMRKQDSTTEKGKKFALETAKTVAIPAKALGSIVGDAADYGLRKGAQALIDHTIDSAKWKADKDYKRKYNEEHKSELNKLEDKRKLEEAKSALKNQKLSDEVQEARYRNDKSRLDRESAENYFQRSVLDADDIGSAKAADRLKVLKQVRSNDGGNNKNHNKNRNKNQQQNYNSHKNQQQNRNNNKNQRQNTQNRGNNRRNNRS